MVFEIGDKIAHPLHGAGVISGIDTRRINGENKRYYVLNLPGNGMVVMVPVDTCEAVGVRPLASGAEIDKLFSQIPSIGINMTDNWNKRYRENMQRLKSGDMLEVAAVIKGLVQRETARGLSTGERRMLNSAKQILLSEVILSTNCSSAEAEARLLASLA